MTIVSAILLVYRAPYTFCRKHEWRRTKIDHAASGGPRLWPVVTIGWWTWDPLPEQPGQRIAEVIETIRDRPAAQLPLI